MPKRFFFPLLTAISASKDVVIAGSHLDSQPTGGRYDGCYGVLAGLLAVVGVFALKTRGLPGLVVDFQQGFIFWLAGLALATLMAIVATIPVLWRSASVDVAAQLSSR